MKSNIFKFTDPATGKSFRFTFNPPKVPQTPIGGYNPSRVAKRAVKKRKK